MWRGSDLAPGRVHLNGYNHQMNPIKSYLYLALVVLLVIAMIGINELGYGVFALLLSFPACWMMAKAFEEEKPSE